MKQKIFSFLALIVLLSQSALAIDPANRKTMALPSDKLTWDMLKDVTFKKKWYPQESIYMLYPTFGPGVKKLENKEVTIKGYVIPVDAATNVYVLSAFPYSQCFFCGGAGPESVMSLKPKKGASKKYKTDEMHTFTGKLKLNADDIYEMNYILEEAEVIE